MSSTLLRRILRAVAVGAPLSFGVMVLDGCQTNCSPGQTAESRHPRTPFVEAVLGSTLGSGGACDRLCRSLDMPADAAGPPSTIPSWIHAYAPHITCRYEDDELVCHYETNEICSTSTLCSTSTPGRAPQALLAERATWGVGGWLAEAARLEAASVPAFEELARELSAHGAPRTLVRGARASARDEVRHARVMTSLARAYGAEPTDFRRGEHGLRSLEEVAVDNAAEGCVREALGALAAVLQAERAMDPTAAAAFRSIARDEARHALLSFEVDDWARSRLPSAARGRMDEARDAALSRARHEASFEPPTSLRVLLGAPDATRASDLAALAA